MTVSPTAQWTVNGVAYAPANLEITQVERLTSTGKYIEVLFNKPLTSLEVSELAIRNSDTLSRVGIEKVSLASDGLSAQITLLGDEASPAVGAFIQPHQDYTLTITQGGKVTSKKFNLDRVLDNQYISTVDSVNNSVQGKKLADNVVVDFENVLGRTATYSENKDGFITDFKLIAQTVKYDAIEITEDRNGKKFVSLENEGKEYALVNNGVAGADFKAISKTTTAWSATKGQKYEYAKLVFNNRGEVSSVVVLDKFTSSILVDSTTGTIVNGNGLAANLKDYTIVKNGETISVADIKKGDVVYYNTSAKFADVYTSKATAKIDAVYAGEFKFNGEVYKINGARYVKDGKVLTLDQDGIDALAASDKDVTVYFDRQGNVDMIVGELGEVISNTTVSYLTKNVKAYEVKARDFIELATLSAKGDKAVEEIALENLKSINNDSTPAKYEVGKMVAGQKIAGFKLDSATAPTEIRVVNAAGTQIGTEEISLSDLNKDKVVELVKDKDGVVVGINFGTKASVKNDAVIKTSDKTISVDSSTPQVKSSTPVFWVDDTKATPVISVTTWGALASEKQIKEIPKANLDVFHDGQDVDYLVVRASGISAEKQTEDALTVISEVRKDTDGNVAYVKLFRNGEVKEYALASTIADAGYKAGDIVTATINKETGKLEALAPSDAVKETVNNTVLTESVNPGTGKFEVVQSDGSQKSVEVAATGVQVYELDPVTKKVTALSLQDLSSLENDNKVTLYYVDDNATTKYVNAVVVTKDTNAVATKADGTFAIATGDITPADASIKFTATAGADKFDTLKSVAVTVTGDTTSTTAFTKTVNVNDVKYSLTDTVAFSNLLNVAANGSVDVAQVYSITAKVNDGTATAALTPATNNKLTIAKTLKPTITGGSKVLVANNFGVDVTGNAVTSPVILTNGSQVTVGDYKVTATQGTNMALTATVDANGVLAFATTNNTADTGGTIAIEVGGETVTLNVVVKADNTVTIAAQ